MQEAKLHRASCSGFPNLNSSLNFATEEINAGHVQKEGNNNLGRTALLYHFNVKLPFS